MKFIDELPGRVSKKLETSTFNVRQKYRKNQGQGSTKATGTGINESNGDKNQPSDKVKKE